MKVTISSHETNSSVPVEVDCGWDRLGGGCRAGCAG
jgi:hypothetical protein